MNKTLIALLITLSLAACSNRWKDFNYGPGDWLAENLGLKVDSPYTYEILENPIITVHVVDDLTEICGGHAWGCASTDTVTCNIYIGERASPGTIAHEHRHCYGWSHAKAETTNVPGIQWYPTTKKFKEY